MKNLHRDRIEKITQYHMVKPIVVCKEMFVYKTYKKPKSFD